MSPLTLTGDVAEETLPRVAGEPVTITVARTVRPGWEAEFLRWQGDVVAAVTGAPGCLGATVLHPGFGGGGYQTVFRFEDGMSLRAWEQSAQRARLMEAGEPFVLSQRVTRTVGVESWFELPRIVGPRRSWWRAMLGDLMWIYPVSIIMSLWVAPLLMKLGLLPRVLVSTMLFLVVMRFIVVPARRRLRDRRGPF